MHEYQFRPKPIGYTPMNQTTPQALHAMKKDELIEFTKKIIKHYNASLEESRYKDKVIDSRTFQVKKLLNEVSHMQDTLRFLQEEIQYTLESAK